MTKKLTLAQLNSLKPYADYFRTAIRSGYASYPGEPAIKKMQAIWQELTGQTYPMSPSCSFCIMNLLTDMGNMYFAQRPKEKEGGK